MSSSALQLPIEASSQFARPWATVQAWSHFETRSSMIVHFPIVCAPSIRRRSMALRMPSRLSSLCGHLEINRLLDILPSLMCALLCRIILYPMLRSREWLSSSGCARRARPVSISVAKLLRMARLWRWSGCFDRNYFQKKKSTTWVHSSKRSWHESLACRKAELLPLRSETDERDFDDKSND